MENGNKRYEITSRVRVPDMDEIRRAASDFSEAPSDESNKDFIARNAKNFLPLVKKEKLAPQLDSIKKEMVQLANVVAIEEQEKNERSETSDDSAETTIVDAEQDSAAEVKPAAETTLSAEAEQETVQQEKTEEVTGNRTPKIKIGFRKKDKSSEDAGSTQES